jgi:hypothetical protein
MLGGLDRRGASQRLHFCSHRVYRHNSRMVGGVVGPLTLDDSAFSRFMTKRFGGLTVLISKNYFG